MHLPELAGGTGLLLLTATNAPISPWISRKIVHMGVGTLLLNADITDPNVVSGIYIASAGAIGTLITTNGIKHISDGRRTDNIVKDIGIFGYIISCCLCLALSVPYSEISPLFYADPAGAIIGRTIESPKIWENKTFAGTGAVFGTAFITTTGDIPEKLSLSILIAIIELFGGKIDNSLIAFFLILKYIVETNNLL
tara:strand:- start:2580 stop:3167 length:588 start_codon:yes stop_codon:yes gene_type:complete